MSVELDPWLQQALRHAPGRDLAVPESVRDTILTAARTAVRQPRPAAPRRWWQGWWPQSGPARLGYSGALMALLVVGLWGVDRLEQPAAVPERDQVLAVPATVASPPAAAVPDTTPQPAAPETTAAAQQLRREATTATRRAMDAPAAPAKAAEAERRRVAAPGAVANHADTAPAKLAEASPRASNTATVATAPPAPAPLAAAAPAPASSLALSLAPPADTAVAASPRMAKTAQPEPYPADPLAQARQAWRLQPDLAWQTATGQQGPQGPVQEAWLTRLQQALSGPWQLASRPASPPTLQWPGEGAAQLWLDAQGRVWLAWFGQVHAAPLPAAEASALLGELTDWR